MCFQRTKLRLLTAFRFGDNWKKPISGLRFMANTLCGGYFGAAYQFHL